MQENNNRLRAVLAALRSIRAHIDEGDADADWDTAPFDRWIVTLEGIPGLDPSTLTIDMTDCPTVDYLMHLDAAIAYLEAFIGGAG
jgi:hypothetical protein